MQKRLLIGAGAAAVVFGGAYGFAATINLTSDNLGAGGAAVLTDCSAATVSYDTEFETGEYYVENVIVDAAGCASDDIGVTLTDSTDAILADGQAVAAAGGIATINVDDDDVRAEDVDRVDVVAHTGASTSPEVNAAP